MRAALRLTPAGIPTPAASCGRRPCRAPPPANDRDGLPPVPSVFIGGAESGRYRCSVRSSLHIGTARILDAPPNPPCLSAAAGIPPCGIMRATLRRASLAGVGSREPPGFHQCLMGGDSANGTDVPFVPHYTSEPFAALPPKPPYAADPLPVQTAARRVRAGGRNRGRRGLPRRRIDNGGCLRGRGSRRRAVRG